MAVPGSALRRAVPVVLVCVHDGRQPPFAADDPDLGLRPQLERGGIEAAEADLHQLVSRLGRIEQPSTAPAAKAATLVGRELTGHLECLEGPLPVHGERAPRLLPAVGAVAASDVNRLTANDEAHRTA